MRHLEDAFVWRIEQDAGQRQRRFMASATPCIQILAALPVRISYGFNDGFDLTILVLRVLIAAASFLTPRSAFVLLVEEPVGIGGY
jgi:hypothetical protein